MERTQQDLPVCVDLDGALAQEVAAWVEVEAGWQVVGAGGPPSPAAVLASRVRPGPPCVVVIDGEPTAEQARAALLDGAVDVIGWPGDRERLRRLALGTARSEAGGDAPALLRVAGAAGGVGASTIALALGGLLAWSGRRIVVVGGDDLLALCGEAPWRGPGAAELAALAPHDAGAELAALTRPVRGVRRLRVLGGGGGAIGDVGGWPADAVVADLGVAGAAGPLQPAASMIVARPDARLRVAGALAGSTPVLMVGDGPLDRRGVRRLLGQPVRGWVPTSARVARAAVAGRVPAGLPGSWLSCVRDAVRRCAR